MRGYTTYLYRLCVKELIGMIENQQSFIDICDWPFG